jgi:hypothetical protein
MKHPWGGMGSPWSGTTVRKDGVMTEAEVKQVVRDGLCRDCEGTRYGKGECYDEVFCFNFKLECVDIEEEA